MKIFKSQRGDTIAEVLISVAVLSLILSISYALANRATLGNRQSQERSEAQKINNTQIELLKAYLAQPGKEQPAPAVTGDEKAFCIKSSDMSLVKNPATSSDCKTGTDSRYATKIVLADGSYIATTEWDRINGQGKDTLKTAYKVYATNGSAPDLTGTTTGGVGGCAQPALYESNGSACLPIPPNIYVTVKKIKPGAGNTTPNCSSTDTENKAGIPVRLNGGGAINTNASSTAEFLRVAFGTSYTVSYTLPTSTATASTGNPYYEACPPPSPVVATTGAPAQSHTVNLKYRPVCKVNTYQHPTDTEVDVPGHWGPKVQYATTTPNPEGWVVKEADIPYQDSSWVGSDGNLYSNDYFMDASYTAGPGAGRNAGKHPWYHTTYRQAWVKETRKPKIYSEQVCPN